VAAQMRTRRSGRIINISSVAGRLSTSPLSSYMASKWALEALSEALAGEMKAFNVRVAIIEPGIIDTAMAHRIGDRPDKSAYPQPSRFAYLFEASLKGEPPPPALVAQKIVDVATSDSWQLRYTVGPDAEPFLGWRRSMTDEQWVELNGSDDDTWYARIESDFGMDTRPKS
jgi:NAD(P)-dependent dehydrogenase (short-subunit alcohol dehydrogenase family)